MVKIILLVLVAEAFTAVGQILLKKGANNLRAHSFDTVNGHLRFLGEAVSAPFVWMGLAALAASLVFWLMALAGGDLSLVFPMGSIQYIIILFLAHTFLGERITAAKFAGTFLVSLGIILIAIG